MEEQALSAIFETLRKGKCIAILGSKSKEAETNLFLLYNFSLSSFYENFKD
jgi:3,4-dihydroxy-2-butanone 4-phosphate synthase